MVLRAKEPCIKKPLPPLHHLSIALVNNGFGLGGEDAPDVLPEFLDLGMCLSAVFPVDLATIIADIS
jgi:hypothetical protein